MKIIAFAAIFAILLSPVFVWAKAWWGEGAKPQKWILNHGGTLIRYKIENYSGSKKEYKVVMYSKKGKYIEAEWGVEGIFDDAKDGVYVIKARRGDLIDYEVKENRQEGKTFATVKLTAHPGESIDIKFDYKKKKAKISTDYAEPAKKEIADDVIFPEAEQMEEEIVQEEAIEPIPDQDTDNQNALINNENVFIDTVEDFVHPDAFAKTGESGEMINEDDNEENKNFFEGFLDSVLWWLLDLWLKNA